MELKKILELDNIAEDLDEQIEAELSTKVLEQFNNDKDSRSDHEDKLEKIVKLALAIADEKSFPWENASNVIYPLIATAAVEFGARCYPEVVKDGNIVKAKVFGKDDGQTMHNSAGSPMVDPNTNQPRLQNVGAKQKRGTRVASYMNWELSEDIPNWEESIDKLFHALPVIGTMFKKVYRDPSRNRNISQLVFPDKLVINNSATSIDSAPATHVIELYNHDVLERIRRGIFVDFEFDTDVNNDSNLDSIKLDLSNAQNAGTSVSNDLHIFLEQHTWFDLDDDGFLEPYIITIHQATGTVVRMVKRFEKEDVEYNKKKEVCCIKAQNLFVPYFFLPSPDGSFYGIGLGHLLFNINQSLNTSINQLIDAGTMQNTGGGFLAKSLKVAGGGLKFRPGEYKFVDSAGGAIRDSIVTLPTPEPSQTLFALLGFLAQAGKELGSLRDVLTGEQAGNVQATTMMSLVEQGIKQFRAVYKRIHLSLKKELKMIYHLNGKYLDNEKYSEILDEPIGEVDVKGDFSKKGYDIVPVADIDNITNMQRMAKANFLMTFLNDPFVDQMRLRKEIFESFGIEDREKLITPPPEGQPDAAQILAQSEVLKQQNEAQKIQIKSVETMSNMEKYKYDIEKTVAEVQKLKTDSIKNIADAAAKEKDLQLKTITSAAEQVRKEVELAAKSRENQARENTNNDPRVIEEA